MKSLPQSCGAGVAQYMWATNIPIKREGNSKLEQKQQSKLPWQILKGAQVTPLSRKVQVSTQPFTVPSGPGFRFIHQHHACTADDTFTPVPAKLTLSFGSLLGSLYYINYTQACGYNRQRPINWIVCIAGCP